MGTFASTALHRSPHASAAQVDHRESGAGTPAPSAGCLELQPLQSWVAVHCCGRAYALLYVSALAFAPTLPVFDDGTASTLTGYFVDKLGTGLITVVALVFSLPWLLILIVQSSLPLFIVVFALASKYPKCCSRQATYIPARRLRRRRDRLATDGRARCGDSTAARRWL